MLIKKVRLLDRDGLFDIRITDGKFEAIAEEIQAKEGEEIIEGNGALASAPFIEPHIHLDTTLTAGEPEVRAWTIKKGTKAPVAAGKIHSDIQRGFIKAEIVSYDDLIREGSMLACKEKGLVRSEGKEYVMQDGDIVLFRFNV